MSNSSLYLPCHHHLLTPAIFQPLNHKTQCPELTITMKVVVVEKEIEEGSIFKSYLLTICAI